MNVGLENRWPVGLQSESSQYVNPLANLTIKQIEFNHLNQQPIFKHRNIKNVVPQKVFHGYYKIQSKNKKILLPGLQLKPVVSKKQVNDDKNNTIKDVNFGKGIRNTRNSQILNSIIEILKTDPDVEQPVRIKNFRLKTQPPNMNEFIQSREISSVKNSRGPKIVNNQIMMSNQKNKRNLVSEQKTRPKILTNQSNSVAKNLCKKLDAFDQMEMTFYKPNRIIISQKNVANLKKLQQNQFILS